MQVSNCHHASLITATGDEGTSFYICNECKQPCDAVDGKPDTSGIQTSSDMLS